MRRSDDFESLCAIYPSPQYVQQRLLKHLYHDGIPCSTLERFNKHSTMNTPLPYWSVASVEGLLAELCPWDTKCVSTAAPVIHQILLHHSVWPFKPDDTSTITLKGLAVAVALLTSGDQIYIRLEERRTKHAVQERPRDWTARCRLLFQSLCCNSNWTEDSINNRRGEGDDDDLVAVLHESMPQRQKQNRKRFLPVAATLPSSFSQRLTGRVSVQAVEALVDLLCTVASGDQGGGPPIERKTANVAGSSNGWLPICEEGVDWEQFCTLAENSMPFLLAQLASTMRHCFPGHRCGSPHIRRFEKLPLTLATTLSRRRDSSLSPSYFAELSLVAPDLVLNGLALLAHGTPVDLSCHNVWRLISVQSVSRLLYIYGVMENGPVAFVFCFYTSSTIKEHAAATPLLKDVLLPPRAYTDRLIQLHPIRKVVRGSFTQARVDYASAGALSIHLGGVSIWFDEGLEKGALHTGDSPTLSFVSTTVEVWAEDGTV